MDEVTAGRLATARKDAEDPGCRTGCMYARWYAEDVGRLAARQTTLAVELAYALARAEWAEAKLAKKGG